MNSPVPLGVIKIPIVSKLTVLGGAQTPFEGKARPSRPDSLDGLPKACFDWAEPFKDSVRRGQAVSGRMKVDERLLGDPRWTRRYPFGEQSPQRAAGNSLAKGKEPEETVSAVLLGQVGRWARRGRRLRRKESDRSREPGLGSVTGSYEGRRETCPYQQDRTRWGREARGGLHSSL